MHSAENNVYLLIDYIKAHLFLIESPLFFFFLIFALKADPETDPAPINPGKVFSLFLLFNDFCS